MELYDFQKKTVEKLVKQQNVLIGDDMGLGKTVTAIALDLERRKQTLAQSVLTWLKGSRKMTLVITLKSTLSVWEDHYKEWAPHLKVVVMDLKRRGVFVSSARAQEADVYICHWEALRLEPALNTIRWLHIISDEVQKGKNRKAQLTQAWKRVHGVFKTNMSGTWADNRPDDAWSPLNHLYPKQWGSYHRFFDHHVIQQAHNEGTCLVEGCGKYHKNPYKVTVGVHDAEGLQRQMAPFYVRHLKEEVLTDLPDKYYTTIRVDLHPQQRRAYDDMRRDMLAWVGAHENEPLAAPVVISQLTRLQQFGVAYGQMERGKRRNKAGDMVEVDVLRLTEPSSKLDAVQDIIDSRNIFKDPLVVFSKSKQVINLLAERLRKEKLPCAILTGDTSQLDRGRLVQEFQDGKLPVFAGTIAAGGVGITLTRASTVGFLDRDWRPSNNRQAEDRLHRIGQRNAVQVIDFIARDTVDAGHLQKLELKWEWLRKILGDDK